MQGRPRDLTGLYWSIFQSLDFRLHHLCLLGSPGARVGDTGWWGCLLPPSSEGSWPLLSSNLSRLSLAACSLVFSEILKQIRVKQCPFYPQNLEPSLLPESVLVMSFWKTHSFCGGFPDCCADSCMWTSCCIFPACISEAFDCLLSDTVLLVFFLGAPETKLST